MAQRSRYEQKCKDCGSSEFVDDRAAGDLICQVRICVPQLIVAENEDDKAGVDHLQVCGLVAESHVIDESSEWRTFADSVSFFFSVMVLQRSAVWCVLLPNCVRQVAGNTGQASSRPYTCWWGH